MLLSLWLFQMKPYPAFPALRSDLLVKHNIHFITVTNIMIIYLEICKTNPEDEFMNSLGLGLCNPCAPALASHDFR